MSEPEYVRKYKFYEKVFQAKVIELKKIYLDGVARSGQGHIHFLK